ncbi:MAG: 4-hydroxy-3-methylbut-2-enyl diphosphate reductase [Bacteroidales bacterium]|nr:4-hydroxy-3-methylbut-2-enyl diphosphate reductase [Bacteroidales bacterium]
MVTVDIDPGSGFCGGVIRAISRAERFLDGEDHLFSLGAIVHNEAELDRLGAEGLRTVASLSDVPESETVLIRAHGEPPATYDEARRRGLTVIDCTCPVVLKLQEHIREAYARLHAGGLHGTLLIFGKIGHAEVLGLLGQVGGDAIVVEDRAMLETVLPRIDFSEPVEIFSQTTKSPSEYAEICARVRSLGSRVTVHDTICAQVANRHEHLAAFALAHDILLFVAGEASSNGKVLFDLCRGVNPRTWRIGSPRDIDPAWFRAEPDGADGASAELRVGVCGATSTPKWLLEAVADAVRHT